MEQMPNSEPNAELNTSDPTCHNTMLWAGVFSADVISNNLII